MAKQPHGGREAQNPKGQPEPEGGGGQQEEVVVIEGGQAGSLAEDAGEVRNLPEQGGVRVAQGVDPENVSAVIAYVLLGILTLLIAFHYVSMLVVLSWESDVTAAVPAAEDKPPVSGSSAAKVRPAETLERIFNSLLPVISGLVGSAVAYYFSRERLRRG